MKKIMLLFLGAAVALLAACGGSQESAETPAAGPAAKVNLEFGSLSEARDYLLANYSKEKLKEMYVEFSALSRADTEFYYKRDASGDFVDLGEDAENEIIKKMSKNIDDVIKRFGISHALFAALMQYSTTTDWGNELKDQIDARAAEILAERTKSADAPQ